MNLDFKTRRIKKIQQELEVLERLQYIASESFWPVSNCNRAFISDDNEVDFPSLEELLQTALLGHEAVFKLLLATNGVEVNSKSKSGWTPLSYAAEMGHEVVVKPLLATDGVEANSKNKSGRTSLSYVAEMRHEAVVKLLLAKEEVDPDSMGNNGRTRLSLAAAPNRVLWNAGWKHEAIVESLLTSSRVDVNTKDVNG
jgi:hypothetical protein